MTVQLINGIVRHLQFPETFWIPANEDIARLQPGDYVKIGIEDTDALTAIQSEKFWVCITNVTAPGQFEGFVSNDLVVFAHLYKMKDPIKFSHANVLDLTKAEETEFYHG